MRCQRSFSVGVRKSSVKPSGARWRELYPKCISSILTKDGKRETSRSVPHTVTYAVGDNRIDIKLDGGAISSLRWATKNEWLGLIDVAGLRVEALYGGFAGEPFGDHSREYVFVARRC